MKRFLLTTLLALASVGAAADRDVDLADARRWTACPGWVTHRPSAWSVARAAEGLAFRAEGFGTEMPWLRAFTASELDGDSRYLLVRYRAQGLDASPGVYFLHGWDGTVGGRAYAFSDEPMADGAWRLLAVDLAAGEPEEATTQVALKLAPGPQGKAEVTLGRVWFADALPADARLCRTPAVTREERRVSWSDLGTLTPAPGWTTTPSAGASARLTEDGARFAVPEAGRGMRWPVALRAPVDLARTPCLSLRYRATGGLVRTGYTIWLGDDPAGSGGRAVVALNPGDLVADGRWHTTSVRLGSPFAVTHLAVGLDCDGAAAELTLGDLTFSSRPRRWSAQEMLPHRAMAGAWPTGFRALPEPTGGRPASSLWPRIGLQGWFKPANAEAAGAPFRLPSVPDAVRQTGTGDLGSLTVRLDGPCREAYLLTAVAAPEKEPFGLEANNPRKQELLSEPEKALVEIRYASGPPDRMVPVDAATGLRGLPRGLAVCVVHPDATRKPVSLTLLDRMQTASVALVAATAWSGAPRVPEPRWKALSAAIRTRPSQPRATALHAALEPDGTLRLNAGRASAAPGPLFEVDIAGRTLPASEWAPVASEPGMCRLRHAATGLVAEVAAAQSGAGGLTLRMTLHNQGSQPRTATLRFPVLRGVRFDGGRAWCLSGRRGGILTDQPVRFRDGLGEPHPLQMDGFFCPETGDALALITHDTAAQHHFINLGLDASGGAWAPEYVERDLAPGASFAATEAEVTACTGGWRAIFATYRKWLAGWYCPPPAKPWFQRTFAFITRNAHYESYPKPTDRGAVKPAVDLARKLLGWCDMVHLFGWSSLPAYGDWGDYAHYDEAVGGLPGFRANIGAAQAGGVAVGLYQDGYLSNEKGQTVGSRAKEWAMRRADGSPDFIPVYNAYNQCPTSEGWRNHLAGVYRRVVRETGVRGMYIDEYGATDGRWVCHAKDHGHNGTEVPYAGEVATMRAIRGAVGPGVALYTEYPPAEVSRTILDGSFTYQALWSVDQEPLAPHFIDLPRFAFPEFKQFHIIHYAPMRSGNWSLLKFPFFNGESYDLGEPNLTACDGPALAFLRQAMRVLCTYRDAFGSRDVDPLVDTLADGLFANAFRAPTRTVWTLYNANGRNLRGALLRVRHSPGATYTDAWNQTRLHPEVRGGWATLRLELGPKAVGCVVQERAGGGRKPKAPFSE
jgi:hypothetical protein